MKRINFIRLPIIMLVVLSLTSCSKETLKADQLLAPRQAELKASPPKEVQSAAVPSEEQSLRPQLPELQKEINKLAVQKETKELAVQKVMKEMEIKRLSTSEMSIRRLEGKVSGNSENLQRMKELAVEKDMLLAAPAVPKMEYFSVLSPLRVTPGQLRPAAEFNTEGYDLVSENPFLEVIQNPLSTFSIDVDTAAYSNVRRFIQGNRLPPVDAVRVEEMINYFNYEYPQPVAEAPFSVNTELTEAPWRQGNRLLLIGLQGLRVSAEKFPPANLVFLIDVSGSMSSENKLPLVVKSLKMLVEQLRPVDRVSIVVYASQTAILLPSTSGNEKGKIIGVLDSLRAGGSTYGGEGIQLAYKVAVENFITDGNNRVILATDGDFNVGASSDAELERMIEEKRRAGVFLSVLGYGMGNYKDSKMQKLADKGNGNYAYIDNLGGVPILLT